MNGMLESMPRGGTTKLRGREPLHSQTELLHIPPALPHRIPLANPSAQVTHAEVLRLATRRDYTVEARVRLGYLLRSSHSISGRCSHRWQRQVVRVHQDTRDVTHTRSDPLA